MDEEDFKRFFQRFAEEQRLAPEIAERLWQRILHILEEQNMKKEQI